MRRLLAAVFVISALFAAMNVYAGELSVTKCTVTAGSKVNSDKISFSGTMDATVGDFSDANKSSEANFVKITIYVFTFPVNSKTFKNGKFGSTITSKPSKTSFTFDTKKTTFSFSASNVDLTGLSCPFNIEIKIAGYIGTAHVDEDIVNGSKPIPILLMMGVKDVLRVDKCQIKQGKKTGSDRLSVSGGFAVEDTVDMASEDLVVTLGTQTFTIPTDKFKANKKGDKFSCSKVTLSGGEIAYATFDFSKCTFTLTIKNTNFAADAGDTDFGITFASFIGSDEVTLL